MNDILKHKNDLNGTYAKILRTMITANRPLRQFEIADLSGISKERIFYNLDNMISKGIILMKEIFNIKVYFPQKFYLDPSLLETLYDKMTPFIDVINKHTDREQMNIDNKECIRENIKIIIDLFKLDLDDIKDEVLS